MVEKNECAERCEICGGPKLQVLEGLKPVVVYFENAEDRDTFIAAIREWKPGLTTMKVGRR